MSPETVARLVLFGLALAAFVGIVYVVIRPIELVLEWIAERRGERVADNRDGLVHRGLAAVQLVAVVSAAPSRA